MAKKRYLINNRLVSHKDLPPSITAKANAESPAPEAPPVDENPSGYEGMTVKELQAKLDELNIEYPKSAKKGDLIDILEAVSEEVDPEL